MKNNQESEVFFTAKVLDHKAEEGTASQHQLLQDARNRLTWQTFHRVLNWKLDDHMS